MKLMISANYPIFNLLYAASVIKPRVFTPLICAATLLRKRLLNRVQGSSEIIVFSDHLGQMGFFLFF